VLCCFHAVEERSDQTTSSYVVVDESAAIPNAWSVVVSVGGASSRVVPLPDGGELVFGRQQGGQVVIDHDGVSRRHARIMRRRNEVTVEDLESRNGTLVNGDKIAAARRLAVGDVLSIGPASVVIATTSPTRTARQVATIGELEDRLDVEVDARSDTGARSASSWCGSRADRARGRAHRRDARPAATDGSARRVRHRRACDAVARSDRRRWGQWRSARWRSGPSPPRVPGPRHFRKTAFMPAS
jgi:hypothetical protein